MRVSKSEEFGLRLVMSLARDGGRLNIRELAALEQLPETTVAKVVGRLRLAGIVEAERGRNGGYSLTRVSDQITLARVVEAFGHRLYDGAFCERMSPDGDCAHTGSCRLQPVWSGLGAVIGNFLAGITVADVIRGDAPPAGFAATSAARPVATVWES